MANQPTKQQLKDRIVELEKELHVANAERASAQSALETARCNLVDLDRRLISLERRAEDMGIIQENRIAQNQSLGVYHAITSGQVSQSAISLLLMHLIATNPKEFVSAVKRAGLGNFFLNLTSDLEERILAELRSGRKIPAIKLYREATRAGLKEAKEAVEAIGERNGIPRPKPVR